MVVPKPRVRGRPQAGQTGVGFGPAAHPVDEGMEAVRGQPGDGGHVVGFVGSLEQEVAPRRRGRLRGRSLEQMPGQFCIQRKLVVRGNECGAVRQRGGDNQSILGIAVVLGELNSDAGNRRRDR